jgi:hypothetical protein
MDEQEPQDNEVGVIAAGMSPAAEERARREHEERDA